ncbi:MAG: RagB/SusD family nutrient uptake outer membrane protein [Bacteroidota bacterium]|nr:RagB/SusD family nutrient uptake outer membrane protein [Bacteroidota bacterium]
MKTRFINTFFIFSAIAIGIVLSCEDDFLVKSDPGNATVDGFFKTAEDFKLGVNGIYDSMADSSGSAFWGGNYFHMNMNFDEVSDNMVGQDATFKGYPALATGLTTPYLDGITQWKFNYGMGTISKINTMLDIIPSIDFGSEGSLKWEAELLYIRGFLYADMAFLYGGLPLITSVISADEASEISRSTQEQTYVQAIKDLQFAADNLGTTPNDGQVGRPTSMAANTAIGFALLNQKDYSAAATYFAKVIALEGSSVGLVPLSQWDCLNRGCAEDSEEIIWSVQNGPLTEGSYDFIPMGIPTTSGYNGWSGHKFTQDLVDAFGMANGLPITDPNSGYDPNNPLVDRDPRLKNTFYFEGDVYDGGTISDVNFQGVCCNGDTRLMSNIGIAPVFPRKGTASPEHTPEAFAQMNTISNASPFDVNIYRYAGVLLAHAEALNESGDTAGAYAGVNKVRDRAGLPALPTGLSQSEMRDAILLESRVELALEGRRYYDLKRAGKLMERVNSNTGYDLHGGANYKAHFDLWPLPGVFVDNSPAIDQNPGYN